MSQHVCIICGETLSDSLSVCPRCGNNPTAALHLPIGTTLHDGKYAVGKQLGQGGFGITYKAHHTELRRTVVIKELFPGFAFRRHIGVSVPTSRKQEFDQEKVNVINEARVVAGLSSPNIVDVYDVFSENDTAYVVMEYLQGQSLQQQIDTSGSLHPDDVHMIGIQMCNALDEIHRNSFLHRDIKPANIMLTNDGRIVLIDFGSARRYQANITSQHTQIFTHNFAAPEQFSPEARFGPYTDIFGLGATLYTALTGSPPTPSVERLQLDDNRVHFPSGLPNDLCQAIQWALNCRIDERPETAAEFQEALSGTRRIEAMAPTTLNPNSAALWKPCWTRNST